MKTLKTLFLLALTVMFSMTAEAQKITVEKGRLDFLKGISELNVEYDFSNFAVGKFDTEAEYIEKKKNEYNADEAGKGDEWEKQWHADKENTYQRRFEEMMNTVFVSKDANILVSENMDAAYTLILKTTFMEPGFNVGISSKNASINVEVIFIETADPANHIAMIIMNKVPGNALFGSDFDVEQRIGAAYGEAGLKLAQYLWKRVLK